MALLLLLLCPGLHALGAVRGVAKEDQVRYSGATYSCADGRQVPASAVNDDFCDCEDGSDEPGTGACAGQDKTLFHCSNEGATPRLVYASRVDDGVCDCCDGSDEAGLAARRGLAACANSCAEEGKKDELERAELWDKLKVGIAKKVEIMQNSLADQKAWKEDIARLKAELPALEAAAEQAKKEEQPKDTGSSGGGDDLKAEVAELKQTVAKLQRDVEELKRAAPSGAGEKAEEPEAAKKEEKPVVSEYAKWMDGAGSTPGAVDTPPADAEEGEEEMPEDEGEDPGPVKPPVAVGGSSPSSDADKKVRENKDATRELQKKLDQVTGDHVGYANLLGQCHAKHDGQYNYKLCFFEDAKQDGLQLGRWQGWTGPKEATFDHGQMCPGGPERELKVIFECGSKEEVLDVAEPSRCMYEARMAHPGACAEEDMATLEKPPVKHPKDEL